MRLLAERVRGPRRPEWPSQVAVASVLTLLLSPFNSHVHAVGRARANDADGSEGAVLSRPTDELTWKVPSQLAGIPNQRFVLLRDPRTPLGANRRPMNVDILQEFIAPEMFVVNREAMDAIIRLEISLRVETDFFSRERAERTVVVVRPEDRNPRIHYAIHLRDSTGKRSKLRPPSDDWSEYYIPEGKEEIRDFVTTVPLIRCSWNNEARTAPLEPLLTLDALQPVPNEDFTASDGASSLTATPPPATESLCRLDSN